MSDDDYMRNRITNEPAIQQWQGHSAGMCECGGVHSEIDLLRAECERLREEAARCPLQTPPVEDIRHVGPTNWPVAALSVAHRARWPNLIASDARLREVEGLGSMPTRHKGKARSWRAFRASVKL